tara:strand:+ start:123 stop:455 length:333 start_codon:yes stop_codon:yes gene_type:complete
LKLAKRQNDIKIVYEFIDKLEEQISLRLTKDATIKDVIRHLCEYGLIQPKRLRNHMIISEFDGLLVDNKGNITHTFCDLAIKFEMSEGQVGRIIYKERKKGTPSYNIRVS